MVQTLDNKFAIGHALHEDHAGLFGGRRGSSLAGFELAYRRVTAAAAAAYQVGRAVCDRCAQQGRPFTCGAVTGAVEPNRLGVARRQKPRKCLRTPRSTHAQSSADQPSRPGRNIAMISALCRDRDSRTTAGGSEAASSTRLLPSSTSSMPTARAASRASAALISGHSSE